MRIPVLIILCLALAGCASMHGRGADGDESAPGTVASDPVTVAWQDAIAAWRRGETDAALDRLEGLFEHTGDGRAIHEALERIRLDEVSRDAVLGLLEQFAHRHDRAPAWHVLGLMALRMGDADTAERASARVDALAPGWTPGIILEARLLAGNGEHREAIDLLSATVDANPDDAGVRFALAGILLAAGDEPGARNELETILDRFPGFTDAHWTMGLLKLRDGDHYGAQAHFHELLDDPRRGRDAPYYIAAAHEMRGDWEGALEWYARVPRGDSYASAQVKAANMQFNLGRLDAGRARLESLRDAFPDERNALYNVEAELLVRADRESQALSVYDRALEDFPDDLETRYARALLRERTGDVDGAISDFRTLYAGRPDSAIVQNALGYTLADRGSPGDWNEARELIARALEQEPDNPAYIDSMGWVLFRLGELESARAWLSRAWELSPDAEIGAHLGEVLWTLGDALAAKAVWMEAAMNQPEHPVLEDTLERLLP